MLPIALICRFPESKIPTPKKSLLRYPLRRSTRIYKLRDSRTLKRQTTRIPSIQPVLNKTLHILPDLPSAIDIDLIPGIKKIILSQHSHQRPNKVLAIPGGVVVLDRNSFSNRSQLLLLRRIDMSDLNNPN